MKPENGATTLFGGVYCRYKSTLMYVCMYVSRYIYGGGILKSYSSHYVCTYVCICVLVYVHGGSTGVIYQTLCASIDR